MIIGWDDDFERLLAEERAIELTHEEDQVKLLSNVAKEIYDLNETIHDLTEQVDNMTFRQLLLQKLGLDIWYDNVVRNWRMIFTREYRYYYCNLWCFITDQQLCNQPDKKRNQTNA